MGYIAHKAIIVTCFRKKDLKAIQDKAISIIGSELISDPIESTTNGYISFFVAPDGSKEGWEESEQVDRRLTQFCDWMDAHDDKEPYGDYALVCYGGDEPTRNNRLSRPKFKN